MFCALVVVAPLAYRPVPVVRMLAAGSGDGPNGRRTRDRRSEVAKLFDISMRFEGMFALTEGLRKSGLRQRITTGSVVIARSDAAEKNIITAQSYEVNSIYFQGAGPDGRAVRVAVNDLDATAPDGCPGFKQYLTLFSPAYHETPVIVERGEVELVSLRDEIGAALGIGLPILGFWLSVCGAFVLYGMSTATDSLRL
jgi:hypothetical protein